MCLCVCSFTIVHRCVLDIFPPQVCVWNVKSFVEVGPWRTCEMCNVVKQVQPNRKGSSATAHRLVTLWPSHHRAGSALGGNVQIALLSISSFPPPISSVCLSCAPCLLLTHAANPSHLPRELSFTYNDGIVFWWPTCIDILTLVKTTLITHDP